MGIVMGVKKSEYIVELIVRNVGFFLDENKLNMYDHESKSYMFFLYIRHNQWKSN